MIYHCGTVWGFRNCSYLYAIFTSNHAYIGETGNLPTSRWGSHLSKADSSFYEKLRRELETTECSPYGGEFVYIGLHCEVIDREDERKRKFARLAIEDEIHRLFYLNENSFGEPKKLLSRSVKRSPRISLSFDVESFAEHAINTVIEEYQKYLKQTAF
nr:GIY-YIG nuclease family protein [uncultured Pseudomonas sp.]